MMATTNCKGQGRIQSPGWLTVMDAPTSGFLAASLLAACLVGAGRHCVAEDKSNPAFAQRAERNYREAREKFQSATNDAEAAWQFGRACFDWADFAREDDRREFIAKEGIAACRHLMARDPKSAPGHYYLAMDLGQLAQTKTLGALRIVQEMEREFKSARDLEARFDYAGPDRNLGLLYF